MSRKTGPYNVPPMTGIRRARAHRTPRSTPIDHSRLIGDDDALQTALMMRPALVDSLLPTAHFFFKSQSSKNVYSIHLLPFSRLLFRPGVGGGGASLRRRCQ